MTSTKRGCEDADAHPCAAEKSAHDSGCDSGCGITIPPAQHRETEDAPPRKRAKTRPYATAGTQGGTSSARSRNSPSSTARPHPTGVDHLSFLSDELLIRILGYLTLPNLLSLAPVSRRFHRLADDSQLWKAIYYERFVLPRALRIPGFRAGTLMGTSRAAAGTVPYAFAPAHTSARLGHATPAAGRRNWGDACEPLLGTGSGGHQGGGAKTALGDPQRAGALNWKQQYKLRHNWARGACAVEELRLGSTGSDDDSLDVLGFRSRCENEGEGVDDCDRCRRVLVKVVDGIAITADQRRGLRVWELRSRSLLASEGFEGHGVTFAGVEKTAVKSSAGKCLEGGGEDRDSACNHRPGYDGNKGGSTCLVPTALAVNATSTGGLDIAIGRLDGGFEIWLFDLGGKSLVRRFSHPASSNGVLTEMAYSHPYILTATDSVLISLYVFDVRKRPAVRVADLHKASADMMLGAPRLLTSLRSHTSRPPLALSIRKLSSVTIASIAYTFSTLQGWSIGIQDLHVEASDQRGPGETNIDGQGRPAVATTRLAYTSPASNRGRPSSSIAPPPPPAPPSLRLPALDIPAYAQDDGVSSHRGVDASSPASAYVSTLALASQPPHSRLNARCRRQQLHRDLHNQGEDGPTTLCYSHPYLLAAMPDNTLILYLCTSNASTLAISAGIRLWGHTSGISDAEITARGKAVSVSMRGEELRVWELEGLPAAERGRSVAIRPSGGDSHDEDGYDWDERRNWVGFDDEMVIVLKEARGGRESLLVYDFT